MSERKVLNKYFPPNFDPSKIPRRKKPLDVKDKRHKVRLMAPFSMQCETCREYIYKGKKFNAIKETVKGEMYLSIKIFRFYIRCPKCHAEITFKTDPANLDYVAERGAVRNFDPRRDEVAVTKLQQEERGVEEELDPLRALENRTLESKREMDIMDALEEVRTRNARVERVNVDGLLDRLAAVGDTVDPTAEEEEAELNRLAREAFEDAGADTPGTWTQLRLATLWSEDEGSETGEGEEHQSPRGPVADEGSHDDDDGGEEDLDALLLQYRLAGSSSSAAAAVPGTTKAKKRSHGEAVAGDRQAAVASSVFGNGNEWAALAKRVKTASSAGSTLGGKMGKQGDMVVKHAVPAVTKPGPNLLGLAYDDEDEDDD